MKVLKLITLAVMASVLGCQAPQYRVEIQAPFQRPEMANITVIIQR